MSLLIVAHFLVWVMLGIVLKPETALPTISAIIGLCWHCYSYATKLGEFNEKIYSTLEDAFNKAESELAKEPFGQEEKPGTRFMQVDNL